VLLGDLVLPASDTLNTLLSPQISTTKGTGGDLIVLEEAAYVEPGFFYVSSFFLL
jgi:hypothetical protein